MFNVDYDVPPISYKPYKPLEFYRELNSLNTRSKSIIFTSRCKKVPVLRELIALLLTHEREMLRTNHFRPITTKIKFHSERFSNPSPPVVYFSEIRPVLLQMPRRRTYHLSIVCAL